MPDVGDPKNDTGYEFMEEYYDDVWLTADLNNSLATAKPASNSVYAAVERLSEMNNSQKVVGEIGVVNQIGAAWYDREWREIAKANPVWTEQQVYDEMTRHIQEADWNARYKNVISDIANSSTPAEREQKIKYYTSELLSFYVSGIDVDNDVTYLREVQGVEPQYRLAPTNSAFVDATLSFQDIANDYHLEYNSNGIKWRVKPSGVVHPDDLAKFQQQQEYIQSISDNLAAKASMGVGSPIAGNASQETSVVRKEITQAECTFVQGSSIAGSSQLSGKLIAASAMSDMDPYFQGTGNPIAGGDYFSMWRMAIFGHDNPELANNQFKKAVEDTIYKDIYPLMLTLSQVGITGLAGVYTGPYAPVVAAPGNFVLEAAKNKAENYDRSNYNWENAFVDAGKKYGIELVVGMGAKKMSQVIAAKYNLSEMAQLGLEKSMDYLLEKGTDKIMENSQT
jgi:hypothetical protein